MMFTLRLFLQGWGSGGAGTPGKKDSATWGKAVGKDRGAPKPQLTPPVPKPRGSASPGCTCSPFPMISAGRM